MAVNQKTRKKKGGSIPQKNHKKNPPRGSEKKFKKETLGRVAGGGKNWWATNIKSWDRGVFPNVPHSYP